MDLHAAILGMYEVIHADTPKLREACYRLRYETYCREKSFISPEMESGGMEIDCFEDAAEHYLIRHRYFDVDVATVRLILSDRISGGQALPLERYADQNLAGFHANSTDAVPVRFGEVSRMCVLKAFRGGAVGTADALEKRYEKDSSDAAGNCQLQIHTIMMALIACLVDATTRHQVDHWCALMEPSFYRFLKSMGINPTQVGPAVNLSGMRIPCVAPVLEVMDGINRKRGDSAELLRGFLRSLDSQGTRTARQGKSGFIRPVPRFGFPLPIQAIHRGAESAVA